MPEESQPSVGLPDILVACIAGKTQDAIMTCLRCHVRQGTATLPVKAVRALSLGWALGPCSKKFPDPFIAPLPSMQLRYVVFGYYYF